MGFRIINGVCFRGRKKNDVILGIEKWMYLNNRSDENIVTNYFNFACFNS